MQKTAVVSVLGLAVLTACGGGGSDSASTGEITGLQGPEQVTIIESSEGSSSSLRLPRGVRAVEGSDYQTDTTRFWVRDDSMKALDSVNSILGYLHETHYWEQTNNGPYRALVENSDSGGGERGQSGPAYEEWVIDSTRESNSAPQIVKFWVKMSEQGQQALIYGKLVVEEEPTDAQPLGKLTLTFKALPDGEAPTSTNTMFEGYLRTVDRTDGQTEIEFYNGHGDVDSTPAVGEYAMRERVHVVGDMGAGTGRAYTENKRIENQGGSPWTDEGEYQVQFNGDYVARKDVANGNTISVLDRNDYDTTVFRYGLYDGTTEERVEQLSGFPVETSGGEHGWAGYHGIWFPSHVTLTDGMTLYRRSFSDNSLTPYTLVKVPGRLEKRVRSAITFADIVDEDLDFFDSSSGSEARVRFTGSDFVRVAARVNGEWTPENTPVSIASSFTTGQWLNFWSQARGSVEFAWPASLTTSAPAYVWTRSVITADSAELAGGDLTLNGYFHMLRSNISSTEANYQNGDSPYLPDASSVSSGNQTYVFDKETMMLQLSSVDVNFASGVTVSSGPGQWGLNCGPLFPSALSSFNDIANQTTTYEWVIGSNSWNQLLALKDANDAYVSFTAPLRFTYTHDEDGSAYDGRTFFLEWDGTNLHGIPHEESSSDGRWYPVFNIPTGTTLTDGSTTYKVKQLEGEQRMVAVGSPNTVYTAQGFDLSTSLTEPDSSPYSDPAIGALPTVTDAPLYVGGVAQTSDG